MRGIRPLLRFTFVGGCYKLEVTGVGRRVWPYMTSNSRLGISSLTDDELFDAYVRCAQTVRDRSAVMASPNLDKTFDYMFALYEELTRRNRTAPGKGSD